MQRAAQPDVEEVHEIRIGDGVVVGRVGADHVEAVGGGIGGGLPEHRRAGRILLRVLQVVDHAGDPFHRPQKVSGCAG